MREDAKFHVWLLSGYCSGYSVAIVGLNHKEGHVHLHTFLYKSDSGHTVATQWPHSGHTMATQWPLVKRGDSVIGIKKKCMYD